MIFLNFLNNSSTINIKHECQCIKETFAKLNRGHLDDVGFGKQDRKPDCDNQRSIIEGVQFSDRHSDSDLSHYIKIVKEQSFANLVDEYITGKNWSPQRFYKKAHLDRRVYWSIMNTPLYQPSKDTAIKCALALELNIQEANDLLERSGYVLSHSILRDVAIEYCIGHQIFKIDTVNDILCNLEEKIL